MSMDDLERRALLGDRQAQDECTRQGIALPCPFCGKQVKRSVSGMLFYCPECRFHKLFHSYEVNKEEALFIWNHRPAPPIGKCKDCKHQGTGDSDICHSDMDDEFCSGFDPKEDATERPHRHKRKE